MKNQIIIVLAIVVMAISMQSCVGPAHLGSDRTFVDRPREKGQDAVTATAKYNNSGSYAGNRAENISGDLGLTYSKNFKNNTFVQVGGDVFVGNVKSIYNEYFPNFQSASGSYYGFTSRLEYGGNIINNEKTRLGIGAIVSGSIEKGSLHTFGLNNQGRNPESGDWISQALGAKVDFTYKFNEHTQAGIEAVVSQKMLLTIPIGEYYHLTGFATVKKMTYFAQSSYSPVFSYRPIVSVGVGYKF
jgi:hypothetical protein